MQLIKYRSTNENKYLAFPGTQLSNTGLKRHLGISTVTVKIKANATAAAAAFVQHPQDAPPIYTVRLPLRLASTI